MLRYIWLLLISTAAFGQSFQPRLLRFEENYRGLPDSAKNEAWLKLKNISLSRCLSASVGFNWREMLEMVKSDDAFGMQDSYWLTRILLHGELRWQSGLRTFLELGRGIVREKKPPVRPIDEDVLYVLNGFVEAPIGKKGFVRIGRQELLFGAGRLVAPREGPNVRNSFDGVRLGSALGKLKGDIFWTTSVQNRPGILDDRWFQRDVQLWGLYTVLGNRQRGWNFYYLGFQNHAALYHSSQARAAENRHSFGVRLFKLNTPVSIDAEATGQFGKFGEEDIRAALVDVKAGYLFRFPKTTFQPSARIVWASGDGSSEDKKLGAYNPLFPNLLYYQTAIGIFPSNLLNPQLSAEWAGKKWKATGMADVFWRNSSRSGLLGPFGPLPLPASDDKYLGYQLALKTDYGFNENAELTLLVSRYFKSRFIEQNSDPRGVDLLVNLLINIKF